MKYTVNVGPITNVLGQPEFFIGTGFMGEQFSTYEELKEIIFKYGMYTDKDGKRYWHPEIKLTFGLASLDEAFKQEGNRQIAETGEVDLLTAVSVFGRNPFRDKAIYYIPGGATLRDGSDPREFKFLIDNGEKKYPRFDVKLSDILSDIGLNL